MLRKMFTLVTLVVIAALIAGVAIFWKKIADRYQYVDTINHAISLIDANKMALPAPEAWYEK